MTDIASCIGHGVYLGLYMVGVFMLVVILAEAAIRALCVGNRARFDRLFVEPMRRRAARKRRA